MKLASFIAEGQARFGKVMEFGIIELNAARAGGAADLAGFLAEAPGNGCFEAARALKGPIDFRFDDIQWLPPIPRPEKIFCVGLNYKAHIAEVGRAVEDRPVLFLRLASSQVGHLGSILRPQVSDKLDFEGELAVVIGRAGRHIAAEQALNHVAGYSIYNDASVRDWQRHTHQYTPGKNFDGTGAFGPWLVTPDEAGDPYDMVLTTRLNGAVVQQTTVADLMFRIEDVIAYISNFCTLRSGDVIVTGTPSGVGAARKPPLWMTPGDVVEVAIDPIGVLRNIVVQETVPLSIPAQVGG